MTIQLEQLQALALDRSPFEEGPAGEFFFATPALTQRLDLLHHLIQYSDLLIVVTGPPGAGKTSFLAKVLEAAGEHWCACPITAVGSLGVRALLERIMGGLDVPDRGTLEDAPEDRLTRLAAHLESLSARGDLPALLIDDAGSLEDDALELVMQLAMRSESLRARIVLAGEAMLADRMLALADRNAAKDVVHLVELPGLTEEQTGDYLHTRLAVAGMSGDSPFAPETVARIRRESKGIPRAINELAEQELAQLAVHVTDEARRSRLTALLLQWWKGLAAAAVATLMLAAAILLLPAQAPNEGPSAPPPRIVDLTQDQGGEEQKETKAPTFIIHGDPIPQSEPIGGGDASGEASRAPPETSAPLLSESKDPVTRTTAQPAPPAESPALGSPPRNKLPPKAVTRLEKPDSPARSGAEAAPTPPKTSPKPGKSSTSPEKMSPASSELPPATSRSSTSNAVRDAVWIRNQPAGNHTIQLMGTFDEPAMRRFLARSGIGARGAWFRSRHKGRAWFVVVYGSYPTRAAATRAARRLPKRVKPGEPWVRKFADVVQVIE